MYCIKCGKEIKDGADFCQYCGQKQDESTEKNDKNEKKPPSDSKLLLIGVILAAVILGIIAVIRLCGNKPQSTVTESVVTETQTEINSESETIEESQPIESESKTTDVADVTETMEETTEEEKDEAVETVQTPMVKYINTSNYEYWFDEDGDLIKTLDNNDHGAGYTLYTQYHLDSNGNKVCGDIDYLEAISDAIFSSNGSGTKCFSSSGHLIDNNVIVMNPDFEERISFEYDDQNRPVKVTVIRSDDSYYNIEYILEYKDAEQQVIISASGDFHGDSTETMTFNGKRLVSDTYCCPPDIARVTEYDNNGNLIRDSFGQEHKWQYDENQNLIRHEVWDENECIEVYEYLYDDNGREIKSESNVHGKGFIMGYSNATDETQTTIDSQYDSNGYLIKREITRAKQLYDGTGNIITDTSSNQIEIWEYDNEERMTAYSYLSKSSKEDLIESNIRYLYDEHGKLTEIMANGETFIMISYTDTGMLQKITPVKETEYEMDYSPLLDLAPYDYLKNYNYIYNDTIIEYR